jgi:lipoprotein NlpI
MKRVILVMLGLAVPLGAWAADGEAPVRPGAAALTNRANAKAAQGDLDGAAADYTRALALDPRHASALLNRGAVRQRKGDFRAALADYEAALALDPQNAAALYDRAGARRAAGDLDGARADYARVLARDAADVRARINRAVVALAQRDWMAAEVDLWQCLRLLPEEKQIYPRIYLWVAAMRRGEAARAARELGLALDHAPARYAGTWPGRIEGFLAGRMSEARFHAYAAAFEAARPRGQRGQADYYIGLKRLAAGDAAGAAPCFANAAAGDRALHETVLADAALHPREGSAR